MFFFVYTYFQYIKVILMGRPLLGDTPWNKRKIQAHNHACRKTKFSVKCLVVSTKCLGMTF